MKRATYILKDPYEFRYSAHDSMHLPQGAFVVPMNIRWVPKYIQELYKDHFSPQKHVFAYTHHGIIPVPLDLIGEAY